MFYLYPFISLLNHERKSNIYLWLKAPAFGYTECIIRLFLGWFETKNTFRLQIG